MEQDGTTGVKSNSGVPGYTDEVEVGCVDSRSGVVVPSSFLRVSPAHGRHNTLLESL